MSGKGLGGMGGGGGTSANVKHMVVGVIGDFEFGF